MSRNDIYRRGIVSAVATVFILTSLSSVYAGTVFNELKCLDDESIETAISTMEKISGSESIYDSSKMPFKYLNDRIRKPTLIDGEDGYWDIVVPDDYSTIQGALYAADDGYRIFVRSGTYEENIVTGWNDCSLTLHGENKNTTYIIGDGSDHVISMSEYGESNGINISGFTIENSGEGYAGVYLCSGYNILQGNVFQSNSYGVKISGASGNIVQGNVVVDNIHDGVVLDDYSYGNTIEENYISGNDDGVIIDRFSTFNVISGNIVEENTGCGLRVDDVSRSTMIIWNIIRGNSIGVDCGGVSDGILAHHNTFIDNDVNAFDSSLGQWDSGTIGNYWSDYVGIDADGDGIGDEPYNIPGGNSLDNHPLMSPSLYTCSLKQNLTMKECFQNDDEQDQKQSAVSFDGDTIVVPDDYPTIQEALDNAVDGDTVFVRSGTYREHVSVVKCVRIIGENASCTIVDGKRMDYHVFAVFADGVELSGFTIRRSSIGFSGVRVYGNNCNICNNILRNCGGGVELWTTSDTVVNSNTMTNNVWGIYIHFSENCDILNNSIKNNYYGIELGVSPVNISVNRIENNSLNGILCLWSFNSIFKNNSIVSNDDIGLQMFSSDYTIIDNNFFYDNDDGISIYKSSYNKIVNNEINITSRRYHGVSLWYLSVNNYIEYNIFSSIKINIQVDDFSIDAALSCDSSSGKNEIRNNSFYGPENINGLIETNGIELFSDYNIVKNNNISNYCPGIYLSHCNYNIIGSNLLSLKKEKINFYTAIEIGYHCNYNTILDNTIIGRSGISNHGIDLWGCENTIIDNNIISGFSGLFSCGIILSTYYNYVINNTITENYFGICSIMDNNDWRLHYSELLYSLKYGDISPAGILLSVFLISFHYKLGMVTKSEFKYNVIMKNKIGISSNFVLCLIEKNSFEHNQRFGIKTNELSMFNIVKFNNFIGNNIHATFKNAAPFATAWYNNYWDNWNTVFPKPIFGRSPLRKIGIRLLKPTIIFDWHPAQEPYDIGG